MSWLSSTFRRRPICANDDGFPLRQPAQIVMLWITVLAFGFALILSGWDAIAEFRELDAHTMSLDQRRFREDDGLRSFLDGCEAEVARTRPTGVAPLVHYRYERLWLPAKWRAQLP